MLKKLLSRERASRRPDQSSRRPACRLCVEMLEDRLVLSGDMVLRWNSALWTAVRTAGVPGNIATRPAAIVQAAVHDTPKMKHLVFGLLAFVLFFGAVGYTRPADVHALFDLGTPTGGPFPSNWFTVPDSSQNTGRRVDLPPPDPGTNPSDYHDAEVLNTLDGFSMQPRLSIPFDGAIDMNTVNSKTVFLISLGDTVNRDQHQGEVVGINQVVWDVATTTLYVGSDALLAQHTHYALIVTNGIHDAKGNPVQATQEFKHFRRTVYGGYNHDLRHAIHAARRAGVSEEDIVVASVFTTLGATAILEKIRDQVHAETPAPADFLLGPSGERTVFSRDDVTGIHWEQQTAADPASFTPIELDVSLLDIVPGAVGQVAFGKYLSPDYEVHPGEYIPAVGTATGTPVAQGMNEIYFNLFLPSGPKPASGWPVAIFGHGNGQSKNGGPNSAAPQAIAAKMAEHGIATIAINAVGHGFGPLGTLTVSQQGGATVTLPAGGRGIDQNGDHVIASTEGIEAVAPRTLIYNRDGFLQTAVDLMQLVRVIQVGMDVDGDGTPDLDPARIYYVGLSIGGLYGTLLLAIEPAIGTAVLNVPAGNDVSRHWVVSPVFRPTVGNWLSKRAPVLLNPPGVTAINGVPVSGPFFNDNLPLPSGVSIHLDLEDGSSREIQAPLVNDVPGAIAIQKVLDNYGWAVLPGASLAYVPHLRTAPLAGMAPKSILVLFDKTDQSVPNPFTSALLRAGDLADRATIYRHDLAFAENSSLPKNAHTFLSSVSNGLRDIALGAQEQVATFFASDGKEIIHPEPQRFFEVPIIPPLPEDLSYIP